MMYFTYVAVFLFFAGRVCPRSINITEEEFSTEIPDDESTETPVRYSGNLFEGDIALLPSTRSGIISKYNFWPNAVIPYVISGDYTSTQRSKILTAMNAIDINSCIHFTQRGSQIDFIDIKKTGNGCYSFVGKIGGVQTVSLDDGCLRDTGSPIHELMHSVGYWHEQSRPDRDDHVNVLYENIEPGYEHNFNKYTTDQVSTYGVPYDVSSVMHYTPYAFTKNRKPTITRKDGSTLNVGNDDGLTALDVQKLKALYKC